MLHFHSYIRVWPGGVMIKASKSRLQTPQSRRFETLLLRSREITLVVHTHVVHMSPSRILILYRSQGTDALRLDRSGVALA